MQNNNTQNKEPEQASDFAFNKDAIVLELKFGMICLCIYVIWILFHSLNFYEQNNSKVHNTSTAF